MKASICGLVILLAACFSMPVTADAFSRRSHSSEVTQSQAITSNLNTQTTGDVSPQAVPEPPMVLLMSLVVGVFALGAAVKAFRKQS